MKKHRKRKLKLRESTYRKSMAAYARSKTKSVTYPLNDKVWARICGQERLDSGYVSSGSEHSAQNDDVEEQSPSLSNLLCGFLDDDADAGGVRLLPDNDDSDDEERGADESIDGVEDLLNAFLVNENGDVFRNLLLIQVSKALEAFSFVKQNKSLLRRNVAALLRSYGHNAAICKTKWESCGGLTAGSYEFIDVVRSYSGNRRITTRYFIDIDFAGEFEIARQTSQYECLFRTLPRVFIGKSENLKQIVKVMSDGGRRSLKSRGLLLPPWRKNRFMQNKWFGSYRRTSNLIPANSAATMFTPAQQTFTVKCRSVGFDVVDGRSSTFFPATTRTR